MTQALTANRLDDGRVVFLTPAGDWSLELDAAQTAGDAAAAEQLAAAGRRAEADCIVVGAYLIEVRVTDDGISATSIREAIRAAGPTVLATPAEGRDVPLR